MPVVVLEPEGQGTAPLLRGAGRRAGEATYHSREEHSQVQGTPSESFVPAGSSTAVRFH